MLAKFLRKFMDKYEITRRIEKFAPLELAEDWDCSGWGVDVCGCDKINKIMLCLTVTNNVVNQAKNSGCDMIISHHPLFYVPLEWSDINIYSAHTNLDRTDNGTTDTLIATLGLTVSSKNDFLRFVDCEISIDDFVEKLRQISPNLRYVNNFDQKILNRIAFCAGSGAEFINAANEGGADAFVTGDLKFHTALDSEIVVFDIGHFESEILILPVLDSLLKGVEIIYAKEHTPFTY